MRIYWIDNPQTGGGHVRTTMPMQELVRRGHTCTLGYGQFNIDVGSWDLLVLGRLVQGGILDALPALRGAGVKIVYDVDDALDLLEPDNPSYVFLARNIEPYFRMLGSADLITASTVEIARHVSLFVPQGRPIVVLPNCVDARAWPQRRGENRVPRLGFAGGNSHLGDLCCVLEAVAELQRADRAERFEFVVFGISSEHASFEEYYADCSARVMRTLHPIFGETLTRVRELLAGIRHTWVRGVPVADFARRLSEVNLDLGLCPLRASHFNRFKSCLKAYEYAMVGTEALCSCSRPYTDELPPGVFPLVPHNAAAWHDAIQAWLSDPSGRRDRTAAQRAWVLQNRTIETRSHLWEEAFRPLLRGRAGG